MYRVTTIDSIAAVYVIMCTLHCEMFYKLLILTLFYFTAFRLQIQRVPWSETKNTKVSERYCISILCCTSFLTL